MTKMSTDNGHTWEAPSGDIRGPEKLYRTVLDLLLLTVYNKFDSFYMVCKEVPI